MSVSTTPHAVDADPVGGVGEGETFVMLITAALLALYGRFVRLPTFPRARRD
jgi:hypothetical protein